MVNGGNCSLFELIKMVQVAFKNQPHVVKRLLLSLVPECLIGCQDKTKILELSILKVTQAIVKSGLNIQTIF